MVTRKIAVALVLFLSFTVTPPLRAELITRAPPPVVVKVRPGVTVKYLALKKPKTTPTNAAPISPAIFWCARAINSFKRICLSPLSTRPARSRSTAAFGSRPSMRRIWRT